MNNTDTTEKKPLTRQQRRFVERIETEARELNNALFDQFAQFFFNHSNPEGEEVQEKLRQLNAQWRVYCRKRQLNEAAKDMIENQCTELLREYQVEKEKTKEARENNLSSSPEPESGVIGGEGLSNPPFEVKI